ncbi:cache domain-containing sensor histidine kinase [Paenibacillus lupini]|uniref:cache domain-containing sensor histidine kinase n=1 Tax=Paenibacillus lupini TaxID=1450204 RepID=UPI0014211B8A|nr:sensor histidine kinase [Paenibacillus lupini]NIK25522.1 two-component system sensor histidine kinase YesM [Paenibacillus lupini]
MTLRQGMLAFYYNLRIKYKIIVLLALMMSVIGVATFVVMHYAFRAYDKEIYKQSASALNSASLGIEKELRNMEKISFQIATDSYIQGYLSEIKAGGSDYSNYLTAVNLRSRLLTFTSNEKYILSFHVMDVFAKQYGNGYKMITLSKDRTDQVIYASNKTFGGVKFVSPDHGDNALIAGREIRRVDGLELDHLGNMAVRIDIDRLYSDLVTSTDSKKANFAIMEKGGNLVYPLDHPNAINLASIRLPGQQGFKIVTISGKKYFITYFSSSTLDWVYVNMISYEDIFHRTEKAKNTVIIVYILLFLLILTAALGFSRSITGPIERLNQKMKRIQLGHFEFVEEQEERMLSKDEAGQLQRNFRMMVGRIDELINENYVKQLTIKDTEFKALQAQINPHFLYNTLESINWSAKIAGHKQISIMVESLGYLLRSTISHKQPMVTLEDEMRLVGHYVAIQHIRFEERLVFENRVPDRLLGFQVPKLSLQPLVENAINHALEQMIEPCIISITAEECEGGITISVEDNGPGMAPDVIEQLRNGLITPRGTGIGLRNIEDRIKMLFGEAYGIRVESVPLAYTRLTLYLPIEMGERA